MIIILTLLTLISIAKLYFAYTMRELQYLTIQKVTVDPKKIICFLVVDSILGLISGIYGYSCCIQF